MARWSSSKTGLRMCPSRRSLIETRRCGAEKLERRGRGDQRARVADVEGLVAPLALVAAGEHGAEARLGAGWYRYSVFAPPEARARRDAVFAEVRAPSRGCLPPSSRAKALQHRIPLSRCRSRRGQHCVMAFAPGGRARHDSAAPVARRRTLLDTNPPREANKGKAIERCSGARRSHGRVPVYIGDARTDEDGFAAAASCGRGTCDPGRLTAAVDAWRPSGSRRPPHCGLARRSLTALAKAKGRTDRREFSERRRGARLEAQRALSTRCQDRNGEARGDRQRDREHLPPRRRAAIQTDVACSTGQP